MRDRVKPPSDGFESFHAPRLSPADGVESASSLFTAPPIESLELLKELGDIAAASFEVDPADPSTPAEALPIADVSVAAPPVATPSPKKTAQTSDDRLLDALLEYHRLRGPKLGARTAPRPSADADFSRVDASIDGAERFASVEIPVVNDFVPKTSPGGIRASRPVQTILKPKPRP